MASKKSDGSKRIEVIPIALNIQKQKLLCAIGKAEQSPTEQMDENIVKEYFKDDKNSISYIKAIKYNYKSLLWKDTIATRSVNVVFKEYQNFSIGLYLDCAKAIYLTYTGKIKVNNNFYNALIYVLTHGRSFGDPTENIFQLESDGYSEIKFEDLSNPLPDSIYMREITTLIRDLKNIYDETQYQKLNVNVTYLSLLILRRVVKKDAQFLNAFKCSNLHDDYVKLCPYPLNNQLPRITEEFNKNICDNSLQIPVLLATHALLNGTDAITKQVLQVTCLHHIKWTGLQLPSLFFQVANLYGMEEGDLWDALCFNGTCKSLYKLAEDYYKQYKMSKADPPETAVWFPYCRAFVKECHRDLSAPENEDLCVLLAYIVDLKKGFKNSFVRDSHWVAKCNLKDDWLAIAKAFHKKYNKPKLG